MSQFPVITAGQRPTAPLLRSMLRVDAIKTSNTDRSATTAFADDPDLTFTLLANVTYFIEFDLACGALAAADIKTAWNVTAVAATGTKSVLGPGSTAADANADNISMRAGVHGYTTSIAYNGVRDGTAQLFRVYESSYVTTTAAGLLALQWAQVTSNATASRIAAGSIGRCYQMT